MWLKRARQGAMRTRLTGRSGGRGPFQPCLREYYHSEKFISMKNS
jgi:hypothetical protein